MSGRAIVLRGDAAHLPLPDASVDLIVTSPPYFGLRSYTDTCRICLDIKANGLDPAATLTDYDRHVQISHHYDGQIGSEATPHAYLEALWACTAEWMRVLKPEGSLFVNLGDKYSGAQAQNYNDISNRRSSDSAEFWRRTDPKRTGIPNKSLMGMPWRYALGCIDDLGLILRAEIVWAKPNGLPESVTDRVRRSHEQVFHFTRQPRYYSAVDEVREAHVPDSHQRGKGGERVSGNGVRHRQFASSKAEYNPLGKLPGSVWEISSAPLTVPARLGVDHFAAYPPELVRRIVLGWSPAAVCTACGQGRRPVVDKPGLSGGDNNTERRVNGRYFASGFNGGQKLWERRMAQPDRITGYACACTPYAERDEPAVVLTDADTGEPFTAQLARTVKAYNLAGWTPPPARPAVVLDPFGGTGTTALVASVHGRTGISVDRSADYCRLARWRVSDPAERARAMHVPKPPPVPEGQASLFDEEVTA